MVRLLVQKGIDAFCPVLRLKHQWSDRLKTVEKPILKSYVFVKVAQEQRTLVRLTDGVVNFVYRSGKPVLVKEKLINNIRKFQHAHPAVDVVKAVNLQNGGTPAEQGKHKAPSLWIEGLDLLLVPRLSQSEHIETTTDK